MDAMYWIGVCVLLSVTGAMVYEFFCRGPPNEPTISD